MIKIAIIGVKGFPAFGGAARSFEEIIPRLSEEFQITTFELSSHADKTINFNGVLRHIITVPWLKRFSTFYYYLSSTYFCLFKYDFDLIITNHLYCGFIIPFLRLRYKVINVVHGLLPDDDVKWNKLDKLILNSFANLSTRFANVVISVSQLHLELLKIKKNRGVFIPNGIDTEYGKKFHVNVKYDYIVFSAARVIKLKGCHTLLEALRLLENRPNLKIIGDIDQVQSYKKELISLSENLSVDFIPLIKDKKELFSTIASAKLFIFPSFNEGLSNMLLEVASLKVPIICSDIPENKAVFNDEEVVYFKVGDAYDLAEKINWASNNYQNMIEKSNNALKKLEDNYSWDIIIKKYEEVIKKLIK